MNRKSTLSIPEQSRNCSASWISFVAPSRGGRSCRSHFGRLPSNWPGKMYAVAHPLRLDYMGLKKPLGGAPSLRRKPAKPAFVELIAPHPTTLEECIIEFESAGGGKMRIHWKAAACSPSTMSPPRRWPSSSANRWPGASSPIKTLLAGACMSAVATGLGTPS